MSDWRRFWVPLIVSGLVLAAGLAAVVAPAARSGWDRLVHDDPFTPDRELTVTRVEGPGAKLQITRKNAPSGESFVEEALGAAGVLMVRLGLVFVAAFLAGAATQRALIGELQLNVDDRLAVLKDRVEQLERQVRPARAG